MCLRYRLVLLLLTLLSYTAIKSQCIPTITSTPVSCAGASDGQLILTIPAACAGPTPYTLNWINSTCPTPTLATVPGPGTYTISGLPACPAPFSVIIFDNTFSILGTASQPPGAGIGGPSAISAVVTSSTQPSCFGACNGVINIVFLFGTPNYTIVKNPGNQTFTNVPSGVIQSFPGLCAGVISFSVTDSNLCTRTFTYMLNQPTSLSSNTAQSNPICNGDFTGSFSVSPTGGTPNYSVVFSTGASSVVSGGGTAALTNLPAGPLITATVTDAGNCTYTTGATITEPSTIIAIASQTNISCGGTCSGAAAVSVSGGVPPYTYAWNPVATTNSINTGLCTGTHVVVITDNLGCSTPRNYTITQVPQIVISPSITNVLCNGTSSGSASVTATGGTGPISFTWVSSSNVTVSTSSVLTNQPAGTYSIFASDAVPCYTVFPITIVEPNPILFNVLSQGATCPSLCDGGATVNPSQGNGAPFSFTWSPGVAGNTNMANGLCAQTYTVDVTDQFGCPASTVVSVTQPNVFTPGIVVTTLNCNGACNGAINSTPSGGNGPYSFTLVSTAGTVTSASGNFSNLCGSNGTGGVGTYTLYIGDNTFPTSCAQIFTVNVNQPANPLATGINVTNVTCFGNCNGVLSALPSGGTSPYTFFWNTPAGTSTSASINGRCASATPYTLTVTDSKNCTTQATAILTQPAQLTVTVASSTVSCLSSTNGTLSATPAGGVPANGYTLTWQPGNHSGSTVTNLSPNIYTVTLANGICSTSATGTVSAPPAITVAVNSASTSCNGLCDGTATVNATGGVGGFNYYINSPITTSNTAGVFGGLCGVVNHSGLVKDANGCQATYTFVVGTPLSLSVAVTGNQASCTFCSGAATVSPSGGTGPYTYSWTSGMGTNSTIAGACPGPYTVNVIDSKSCTVATNVSISPIIIVTTPSAGLGIQCFGQCTGTAQIASVSGGLPPYTYSWTTSPVQTNSIAVGLCANIYTVTAIDSNTPGCTGTGTVSVVEPPDITIAFSTTNVTCFNTNDGAITTTVSGGPSGTYTYSWSPGGMTTPSISNLTYGTYTLTVTSGPCSKTLSVIVPLPDPPITATLNTTDPTSCAGPPNGSICVTASGGNPVGFTYAWSAPATGTSNCATNLVAGAYVVTVTSAACSQTFGASLVNPSGPTLTLVNSQSVSCFGGNTGFATFNLSGAGGYTYTWSPVSSFSTTAASVTGTSLATGLYTVTARDLNGCQNNATVNIAQSTSITLTSTVTNVSCNNFGNGAITVSASGGSPTYSFSWLPSGAPANGTTSAISSLTPNNYSLTLTDSQGCVRQATFVITEPPIFSLTAVTSSIGCKDACTGSIILTPVGGSGSGYTYTWNPGGSNSSTITNLCAGAYSVSARDGSLCPAAGTTVFTIAEPTTSLTSVISVTNETCFNSDDGIAINTANGGTAPYTYSWTSSASTSSVSTGIQGGGTYSATVVDANGCSDIQTFTVLAGPNFSIAFTANNPLCNGICNGSITSTISGAQGPVSFTWLPTGSGANPTGLCGGAGGSITYTVHAQDAMGCQYSSAVILTDPPALTAVLSTTNPLCNDECNGAASAASQNAIGTPTITWLPQNTNGSNVTGLCGGSSFSMEIVDQNNCQFSTTFTLTNPSPLSINASIAPATCGVSNGSITVTGVGGTAPYTYSWLPTASWTPTAPAASTQGSLDAGTYSVIVEDNSGCTDTLVTPLSNSNGPSAVISFTNILCNGDSTGAVAVGSITSSAATLQPVWILPPPTFTGSVRSNVPAGSYSVQLEDANGCITYTGATVSQPPPISMVPNVSLPLCVGTICNGSATLNTFGGASPGTYTYNWTPTVASTSSVVTNLCGGNYVIVVTDTNNCTYVHQLAVPGVSNITVQLPISKTDNICFGDCAGSATVNVIMTTTGGTVHTSSWSNSQFGDVASGLCNTTHTVTVTDTQGCMSSFTVPISSPSAITLTSSVAQPSCGLCNGAVDVQAGGGTGPNYSYLWTTSATTSSIENVCAGLYQVQVTDANNCKEVHNVAVNNSSGITGENVSVQHEACGSTCSGAATITPVGGTNPITFNWINPSLNNSTNTASALCAGSYYVQMTDAQNCVRIASVTVNQATKPVISAFVSPPDCISVPPNGTITTAVSGGALPYNYLWSPGAINAPALNGVGAGNYTLTVTDNLGCSKTEVISMSSLNGPVIISSAQDDADCGLANGSVTLSVASSSSTPLVTWSNGSPPAFTFTSIVNNLPGGVLSVTVTDVSTSCRTVKSFSLLASEAPQMTSHVKHQICNSDCTGEIILIPVGGTLPYTFSWSPSTSTLNFSSSLCTGTYSGTVIDSKGCSMTVVSTVTNPVAMTSTINSINATCANSANGTMSVTISGGNAPYSYTWTGTGGFTANTPTISDLLPGTYTLMVEDLLGCSDTTNATVVSTVSNSAVAGLDLYICSDSSVVLSGAGSSGSGPITYRWISDPSVNPGPPFVTTPTVMLSGVTQTTTMYLETMVDNCLDRDTVTVNVYAVPYLDAGPSHTVPVYSSVTLGGNPTVMGLETVTWTPAEFLDDPNTPNPTIATNTLSLGFTVSIAYGEGCMVSDEVFVELYPEVIISSGFTPNSDGKNDTWIIQYIDQFPENTVEIYNRWGDLLFSSKGYETPWDGTYKGQQLPVGTYYYVIHLNHPVFNKPYTGPVTIFR